MCIPQMSHFSSAFLARLTTLFFFVSLCRASFCILSFMMSSYNRQRTESKYEEENVSSYVDSCVNFTSNVSFHTAEEGEKFAREVQHRDGAAQSCTILVLGSEASLQDASSLFKDCPYATDEIHDAIVAAPMNSMHVVAIQKATRILVGKVTTASSRHNCQARPDVISAIIEETVSAANGILDVYVVGYEGYELCVASAIARTANRSFSAKGGKAEQSYLESGHPVRVMIPTAKHIDALTHAATSIQLCQRLVDAPTNLLDTVTFTEIAVRCVEKLKATGATVNAKVLKGEELREQGYGGLYGTGKAAEFPPHLVTLSYQPKAGITPRERIAFVGKGVVYDTGGLAIKSRDGMCTMKHDMGGAAAIFGAFLALVKVHAPLEISCILCLADNAVGPRSQRNDDIIRLKSGVTVEINNTDAEGRLVLSDGVFHASAELPYTPETIVDVATLTGAQGVATGKRHAAIYANTEASESRFFAAGRTSGDLCYPVLYCPELHNIEFKSEVADFKNSVANRANAQVSCAGQFIGNNLSKEYKGHWVHVDLAGPATHNQATGFGVALLLETFNREAF